MTSAVQTLWAELCVATLADAGVTTCVISPGSRSTPLVTALIADGRFELPCLIDERSAGFFGLGIARATGTTVALVCTSGSAPAHYLPAIVEANESGVPLLAITADRPAELQRSGASQTIDQTRLYGNFARESFALGEPVGSVAAMRAARRTVLQAVARARGPHPGPVHLDVPLRKPLEPVAPQTDDERALAETVAQLRLSPAIAAAPRLAADPAAITALADTIATEPHGIIVVGAMPPTFAGAAVLELAARAGYPVLAEASSGLRHHQRRDVVFVDHFDLIIGSPELGGAPAPALAIYIGAEPVAAGWATAPFARAQRWVLSDDAWRDPTSSARGVVVGDTAATCAALCERLTTSPHMASSPRIASAFAAHWGERSQRAVSAMARALDAHPGSETTVMRAALAALPAGAVVQVGNSLPIRVIDHVWTGGDHTVIAQRGAAGIEGMIASAAGATYRGAPVLLVIGDVSFAHDLGGLLAARAVKAPLAVLVLDNGGGRIFDAMPIARATSREAFDRFFATPPGVNPAAVAAALGLRSTTATTADAAAAAVAIALAEHGATIIHAPVTATGAHDVRRAALELFARSRT